MSKKVVKHPGAQLATSPEVDALLSHAETICDELESLAPELRPGVLHVRLSEEKDEKRRTQLRIMQRYARLANSTAATPAAPTEESKADKREWLNRRNAIIVAVIGLAGAIITALVS